MFAELVLQEFALPKEQIARLHAHYNLLLKWNRVLNLTTIYKVEEAVERHYWESLFLAKHLPLTSLRIVDIGSGAGFPGFPVAVARPDCEVTLVESHQRKAVFLREASRGLGNIRVLAKRAENVGECFDLATSRAVSYADLSASLKSLASLADLLTGSEEPPAQLGFEWQAIRLPWGRQRFLRQGRRKA